MLLMRKEIFHIESNEVLWIEFLFLYLAKDIFEIFKIFPKKKINLI